MEKLAKNKRGQAGMNGIVALVMSLGVAGMALAVVLLVLSTVKSTSTVAADGNASAAVASTITAIGTIPSWFQILVDPAQHGNTVCA